MNPLHVHICEVCGEPFETREREQSRCPDCRGAQFAPEGDAPYFVDGERDNAVRALEDVDDPRD